MNPRRSPLLPAGSIMAAALAAGALALACDDTPQTTNDMGMALDSNISLDGGTNPTTGSNAEEFNNSDGGLVELDAEQISEFENLACTGWSAEGENLPATLQLVVDTSRSMLEDAPGSGNQTKWDATRRALIDALDALPPSVSVGLLLYPNQRVSASSMAQPLDACVNVDEMVPIGQLGNDGSGQRMTLQDALSGADVDGYTPTHDAYKYALDEGLVPYSGNASKFMLLITDGAPTMREVCDGSSPEGTSGGGNNVYDQPTQPIIDEIATAVSGHGIRTFLIGSPGSEESAEQGGGDMRPWLSRAAVAGDTAPANCEVDGPNFCHLDMTQEPDFAAALTAGLAAIAGQIVNSCTFAIPEPDQDETIDPTLTNLVITWSDGRATLVKPDNVGDCAQGWRYDDAGNVELCADLCSQIKLDERATVQLTFGCSFEEVETITR